MGTVTDNYTLRPLPIYAGYVIRDDLHESATNAEASAEIAFGKGVIVDTVNLVDGVKLPTAAGQVIRGIAMRRQHIGSPEEYGTAGVKAGCTFMILRKGRIMLPLEVAAATRGLRGFVQAVANSPRTVGAVQPSADSTNTIDTTVNISIEAVGAVGAMVECEVDFTREQ
ncbi:MAG: structural cement protein Gp24 [Alsobacter sp.]